MPQQVPGAQEFNSTREERDAAAERAPASPWAVREVLQTGGTTGSLTDLAGREAGRQWTGARERLGLRPRSPTLTAEEATARFGIEGELTFSAPISEREAAWRQEARRDELFRADILRRNQSIGALEAFGNSIFGAMLDPITVPLNFIPVFGQGALATRLGLGGRAATRSGQIVRGVGFGALEGAVIGGATEGAVYGLAHGREGREYSPHDLMLGVTASALFGATARGAVEGMGWRPPEVATNGSGRPRVTRETRNWEGLDATFAEAAANRGEDPLTVLTIQSLENEGRDPNARPIRNGRRLSSAHGYFQITDGTWRALGGGNRDDTARQIELGVENIRRERAGLRSALGREPEGWEVYLGHQQGGGGARALLTRPEGNAVDVLTPVLGRRLALKAVRDNGGRADMTAGEFAGIWRDKYNRRAARFGGGDSVPEPTAPEPVFDPVPPPVAMMSPEARAGALAHALDDMANDRAVNVGRLIDDQLAAPGAPRPALDEAPDAPISIRHQPLDGIGEEMAVTVRGTEVPVRYAIVEAEDLITSHDDDLIRNAEFPAELQPRDRERAGSQARLLRMEKEFNARRLMTSPDAESGAPIIAGDGVVESGNGRSIMLRRNMRRGTEVDTAYRAELTRRGFDVEGFDKPVLVRIRSRAMTGGERIKLTAEMNGDVTERLSATEQAFADARVMDDTDLGLFRGGEITAVANDAFARRFVDKAGAGQENDLVDGATQRLSQAGVERVQAAMVARAFDDRALVYALFETQDNTIKAIGKGLMGAAPDWARMRAAGARGELAVGADTTEALTAAVALVRHARENRLKLGELVEDWADQDRLLGGEALSPSTRAYLRAFFQDDALKRPSSADHIAETLRATAVKALDTTPGPDLFGAQHAFDAATILDRTSARLRQDAEAGDADASLFGQGEGAAADVDRGGAGERQPQASRGPGSGGRSGSGGGDAPEGPRDRPDGFDLEEAGGRDPELQDLENEIAAMDAELGFYVESGRLDPDDVAALSQDLVDQDTLQLAIDAAVACLSGGGE